VSRWCACDPVALRQRAVDKRVAMAFAPN